MPDVKKAAESANDRFIYSHLHVKREGRDDNLQKVCLHKEHKYIFRSPDKHWYYNLKEDPNERRNRFSDGRKTAKMLANNLLAYEKDCPRYHAASIDIELDKKGLEQLRTLGYVD